MGWQGKRTRRHRLMRRGMPYGDPLDDGVLEDDGVDRGLLFICFNASIERQFETVQREWCVDGNVFGLGRERDFLIAPHDGHDSFTIPGWRPCVVRGPSRPFVITRGGDYLFVPGLDGLRALAEGFRAEAAA
jgi:hypothetical protein